MSSRFKSKIALALWKPKREAPVCSLTVGITSAWVLLSTLNPVVAQEVAADAIDVPGGLQSVVVTAEKREESAQDVPTAISVLRGDDLLDRGIGRSANEVLDYVPNASAGTQQHGRPRWWIRGVGAGQQQTDFANPVGFYLDDVYISNASATGFPLFDLDRVEVLRGPQGTLWGKNTTGGAISVVSAKPKFSQDGYFKIDYGTYDDKIVEGAVGGALLDDMLAGRLSFHSENQGGRFDNLSTGQKDDSIKDNAVRGQLLLATDGLFQGVLNLHYRDYATEGAISTVTSSAPNGVFRNGYIPSTDINTVSTNAPNWSKTTQPGASLNLQWQLGRLALTSITGYEDFDLESLVDSDNTPLEVGRTYTKANSHQLSEEIRLTSPRQDRWNWVSGLHLFNEDIDSTTANARLPNGSVPALPGSTQPVGYNDTVYTHRTRSYAIFGSNTFNATEDFAITAGARLTRETKSLNLRRFQANSGLIFNDIGDWWSLGSVSAGYTNPGNFTSNPGKTWDAFTYDLTPEYKFSEHARTYLKYAHGIKSGGFNTAAASALALNTVEPEVLDDTELGFKSEWFDRKVNFNANAFHYYYKNDQVNVVGLYNGSGTAISYLQNVASAHANGAEFEIEALPTKELHVSASLGLLHTRFDQFDVQNNGGNHNGNEFVRSPHVTEQIVFDYRVPVVKAGTLIVGGDWRHLSKQYYYVSPQNDPLLNQDPYSIVNARIAYTTPSGAVQLTFYVNNLTDTVYKNHALPNASTALGITGDTTYWGTPRTVGGSLIARL